MRRKRVTFETSWGRVSFFKDGKRVKQVSSFNKPKRKYTFKKLVIPNRMTAIKRLAYFLVGRLDAYSIYDVAKEAVEYMENGQTSAEVGKELERRRK